MRSKCSSTPSLPSHSVLSPLLTVRGSAEPFFLHQASQKSLRSALRELLQASPAPWPTRSLWASVKSRYPKEAHSCRSNAGFGPKRRIETTFCWRYDGTNLTPLDLVHTFPLHAFYHGREHQALMEAAVAEICSRWAVLHRLDNFPHIPCARSLATGCDQLNGPPSQTISIQLSDRDQDDRPADVQHASSISRNAAHFHSSEFDTVRSNNILVIPVFQPLFGIR